MGDSWDDEEFEVSTVFSPTATTIQQITSNNSNNWDDEVDEVEADLNKLNHKDKPSQALLDANKKKAIDAEIAFESKMKQSILNNETMEERKARIKKEVEEGDQELAEELFDKKSSSATSSSNVVPSTTMISKSLGSLTLKTKQDHNNLGSGTASKLSDSSTFHIGAFYKSLSKCLDNPVVTAETVDEIINDMIRIRDSKVKAVKVTVVKKSKKVINSESKKHNDIFGGSDYVDKYDKYNDMEDDFM